MHVFKDSMGWMKKFKQAYVGMETSFSCPCACAEPSFAFENQHIACNLRGMRRTDRRMAVL